MNAKWLGGFLILEGIISIAASRDRRMISQAGRVARIGIGAWLMRQKTTPALAISNPLTKLLGANLGRHL
jgi:hypothetical protein